jgi:hypothetical protein
MMARGAIILIDGAETIIIPTDVGELPSRPTVMMALYISVID